MEVNGYLINLFKYPPAAVESIKNNEELKNRISSDSNTLIGNVVWSKLDRMEVRRINSFRDFRHAELSEKEWIGERQFAMIYDFVEENRARIVYTEKTDESKYQFKFKPSAIGENISVEKYRFFGISMVNLMPAVREYAFSQKSVGDFIHDHTLAILDQLKEQECSKFLNESLVFEVYGTLGSADAAIIWLANQYSDVIAMLNAFRMTKVTQSVFYVSNVYTIMGLAVCGSDVFKDTKGYFNVRLITRGEFNVRQFIEDNLKKYVQNLTIDDFDIVLGKYDASISFPSAHITKNIYEEDGLIHFRSEKYYVYIIEAYTELLKEKNDIVEPIKHDIGETELFNPVILRENCFTEIRKKINKVTNQNIFKELSYLTETFWLLYQDYVKNMASMFSYPWSIDLEYSFKSSIQNIQMILENESVILRKNALIDYIQFFFCGIRQTMLHISQAGRLYFDISNSQLKQTGAYSKILRFYYGIIKNLLEIAYQIPKKDVQSEIIPFITFDVKPKVESVYMETMEIKDQRIVSFELPYEALNDLEKYSRLLAHEVFHYIPPVSRGIRNFLFGCVVWTEFVKSVFFQFFVSIYQFNKNQDLEYEEWKVASGFFIAKIKPYIWNWVVEKYDELMESDVYYEGGLWNRYLYDIDTTIDSYSDKRDNLLKLAELLSALVRKIDFSSVCEAGNKEQNALYQSILIEIQEEINKNNFKESFVRWAKISNGLYFTKRNFADDIIYAGREAFSDFFMIQVMKMSEKEYLESIFKFINMYEETDDIGCMEEFRVGMMLDYLWSKKESDVDANISSLIKNLGLNNEETGLINNIWDSYKKYITSYRQVFRYLFSTIDFDKISMTDSCELKEFWNKMLIDSHEEINTFSCNVKILENMQMQVALENMKPKQRMADMDVHQELLRVKKFIKNPEDIDFLYNDFDMELRFPAAASLEMVMAQFRKIFNKIGYHWVKDKKIQEPLWFRGHSKSSYQLIPTLYRIKDSKSLAYTENLSDILEDLVTSFRVHSFHAPEIVSKGNDSYLGTIVSMQHYQVETNFLDWSEQIFSSLYFTLEHVIKNTSKALEENPRIWILNPVHFNRAMRKLQKKFSECADECTEKDYHYFIPALYDDDKEYGRYLPFLYEKGFDSKAKSSTAASEEAKDCDDYPRAIYAPYVNPRIKAQSGTFVIFSIYASGKKQEEGYDFTRFALEKLQDKFLKEYPEERPFLSFIDIDKTYAQNIANEIRNAGITKRHVYPELTNIADELKNEIKQHYEQFDE